MKAHFNEGAIDLPEGWTDKSVNVWAFEAAGGAVAAIRTREDATMPFDAYCAHVSRLLTKNLAGFKLIEERRLQLQGLPAHRVECTWRREGELVHQVQILVHYVDSFVVFSLCGPDAQWEALAHFEKVLSDTLRFRKPEAGR